VLYISFGDAFSVMAYQTPLGGSALTIYCTVHNGGEPLPKTSLRAGAVNGKAPVVLLLLMIYHESIEARDIKVKCWQSFRKSEKYG
jgi:hypothetical protein